MTKRIDGYYWVQFNGVWMIGDYNAEEEIFQLPSAEFTEDMFDNIIEEPLEPPLCRTILTLEQLRKQNLLLRSVMGDEFMNLNGDEREEHLHTGGYEIVRTDRIVQLKRHGVTIGEVLV